MRLTRQLKWTAALVLLGLGAAAVVGCQPEVQIGGNIETPPPPPPPPDQDGDEILDQDDTCPTEKEDQKPPFPYDGCPNLDEEGDGIPVLGFTGTSRGTSTVVKSSIKSCPSTRRRKSPPRPYTGR